MHRNLEGWRKCRRLKLFRKPLTLFGQWCMTGSQQEIDAMRYHLQGHDMARFIQFLSLKEDTYPQQKPMTMESLAQFMTFLGCLSREGPPLFANHPHRGLFLDEKGQLIIMASHLNERQALQLKGYANTPVEFTFPGGAFVIADYTDEDTFVLLDDAVLFFNTQ